MTESDRTQQLLLEENLRESERRFRIMAESIQCGLTIIESEKVVYLNKRAGEIVGYPLEELRHMNTSDITLPEDYHIIQDAFKIYRETGILPQELEFRIVRKDGSVRFVHNQYSVSHKDGKVLGRYIVTTDITDRKRGEEERAKLSSAIEQTEEIVIIMNARGQIEYGNPALEKITGYGPEELKSKNPFFPDTTVPDKQLYEQIWIAVSRGNVWKGHITYRKKDGAACELEQTTKPVRDAAGAIIGFISIIRDVTEKLRMEEQLRQSQKMEAIGTLAGGIAHDFNNILAAIIGFTEMSYAALPQNSPLRHNLEQVLKASDRARNLVKQILSFSRKTDQVQQPVQMHFVVNEAIKLLRASLPATIEIRGTITKESDTVMADSTQMHQVLMNLCTNAAQAMREKGGELVIELTPVTFDAEDARVYPDICPGPHVRLTVRDTGPGIDPAIIGRIFDPFFTTKGPGEGTGMGLAVVHGIVKSHHGTITVYSDPGRGTTFHVLLPCVQQVEEGADSDLPVPKGSESILFVDDEAFLSEIGQQLLESLGYRVTAKQSSSEALALFMKDPAGFDLVITDQTMPHMTGHELARTIKDIKPGMPVILCTGYNETNGESKEEALGIKAVLTKPFSRKALAETIRRVLDA